MSHLYEAAVSGSHGSAATGSVATFVTAAGNRAEIREMVIVDSSGTTTDISLGIPANAGVTSAGGQLGQATNINDSAATASLIPAGGWTTDPTAPTNPFRRATLAGSVGAHIIWQWAPDEFIVAPSTQIVIFNNTANNIIWAVHMKWVE